MNAIFKQLCKGILIFLTPSIILAATFEIVPHKITYKLFSSGFELGTETRILTKQNNQYLYISKAQTEGLVKLFKDYRINAKSIFFITDKVQSKSFKSSEYDNGEIKKQIDLTFNKTINSNNQSWQNNGCVDFLSMFLAIGYDLRHKNQLTYCLADGKKIKHYAFENQGIVLLNLMNEEITTTKLTAKDIEVYIAKKYDYLPILIKKSRWKYEIKSIFN